MWCSRSTWLFCTFDPCACSRLRRPVRWFWLLQMIRLCWSLIIGLVASCDHKKWTKWTSGDLRWTVILSRQDFGAWGMWVFLLYWNVKITVINKYSIFEHSSFMKLMRWDFLVPGMRVICWFYAMWMTWEFVCSVKNEEEVVWRTEAGWRFLCCIILLHLHPLWNIWIEQSHYSRPPHN